MMIMVMMCGVWMTSCFFVNQAEPHKRNSTTRGLIILTTTHCMRTTPPFVSTTPSPTNNSSMKQQLSNQTPLQQLHDTCRILLLRQYCGWW